MCGRGQIRVSGRGLGGAERWHLRQAKARPCASGVACKQERDLRGSWPAQLNDVRGIRQKLGERWGCPRRSGSGDPGCSGCPGSPCHLGGDHLLSPAGSAPPGPVPEGQIRVYSMRFCPYAERTRLVLKAKGIRWEGGRRLPSRLAPDPQNGGLCSAFCRISPQLHSLLFFKGRIAADSRALGQPDCLSIPRLGKAVSSVILVVCTWSLNTVEGVSALVPGFLIYWASPSPRGKGHNLTGQAEFWVNLLVSSKSLFAKPYYWK